MARVHLFELEDQPWFPAVLRDAGTAYLRWAGDLLDQPGAMTPKLRELLERSGQRHLVDLCSGGAGPVPGIVDRLGDDGFESTAVLTDLYPNEKTLEAVARRSEGRVAVHTGSVDATDVPGSLHGCRTLFNALHHFRPRDARRILQSAVDTKQPIATFDVSERSLPFLVGILFAPIMFALSVPLLRPFDWRWIVFTYLIPILPLFVAWDGFISGLRTYSVKELDGMIASLDGDSFEWETGKLPVGRQPVGVTYLLGWPR
jgi:hypothetical protein